MLLAMGSPGLQNLGLCHLYLQGLKIRNRQDIRAELQIILAVVTCAVPGLSVFYSLACFDY